MGKYTTETNKADYKIIYYLCGHNKKVNAKNITFLNLIKSNLCRECRKVHRENDRIFITQWLSLPELTGSPEHVILATRIRVDFTIELIDKKHLKREDIKLFLILRLSAAWWLAHKQELMGLYNCFVETGYLSKD